MPSYQKRKEKREQKSGMADNNSDNVLETLVDPNLVSVIGIASTDKKAVKSPETTAKKEKQKKKHSTPVKKSSTDATLEAMDQKWLECFSRLEAFCYQSLWKSWN